MKYQIEICANSIQSAINAQIGGANRVELCTSLWEGGLTPSLATIEMAVNELVIPVFVLIRPRGGDFCYSEMEFEIMKSDILSAKKAGVKGIVSGLLLKNGQIDLRRTEELMKLSDPLPFTFHRAFDQVPDPMRSLDELIGIGVKRVLTSGQKERAIDGMGLIKDLIKKAKDKIIILPGSGVSKNNVSDLFKVGCREFHLSAQSRVTNNSYYQQKVMMNSTKGIHELDLYITDSDKVIEIKKIIDELG